MTQPTRTPPPIPLRGAAQNAQPVGKPEVATRGVSARTRIPMNVPRRRLETSEIPGYRQHWMDSNPERIAQAIRAGYEFVDSDEVTVYNSAIADDVRQGGNTDLGSRVSVAAGKSVNSEGKEDRLVLMKLKEEWCAQDDLLRDAENEKIASAIRGGALNAAEGAYIPRSHEDGMKNLFRPKTR